MPEDQNPDDMFVFGPQDIPEDLRDELDRFVRENFGSDGPVSLTPEDMPPQIKKVLDDLMRTRRAKAMLSKDMHSDWETEALPSPAQLNATTGDRCAIASGVEMGDAGIEADPVRDRYITILEIVDASEYADTYPDWEERLHMSFVLGKYWTTQSAEEEDVQIGWFPRVALILLTEDWMWDEYRQYMTDGSLPGEPPEWLLQLNINNLQAMGKANNNAIPAPARCTSCGSTAVLMITQVSQMTKSMVGHPPEQPELTDKFIAYTRYGHSLERTAVLECHACGHVDDLIARDAQIAMSS